MSSIGHPPGRTPGLAVKGVGVAVGLGVGLLLWTSGASAQINGELPPTMVPTGEGWSVFVDVGFLVHAFLTLVLAVVLGAVVGYHPHRVRTCDTVEEIDAPAD